jgi:hypothetical protein
MRKTAILTGLAALVALSGCGDENPVSTQTADPAAKLTVSGAAVAGTAERVPVNGPVSFRVTIENIGGPFAFSSSGAFNTPSGATGPGPLLQGSSYDFSFHAGPGAHLSFATMYVQSNDLFFAPDEAGIALFDADGFAINGDVTDQVQLWDAGTEINQEPGIGADQAPRQAGANTGAPESGAVRLVDDGFTYGAVADLIQVSVSSVPSDGAFLFTVSIANISEASPLAPGVYAVGGGSAALFDNGQLDRGEGLEALAEDGNPAGLAGVLAAQTGVTTVLAPGVWALHSGQDPLFSIGQADRGEGLEALAEDGGPGDLATALAANGDISASGVFNTPTGADGPGPVPPGGSYEFTVVAEPGDWLSFATMFVQSNDLFFAPDGQGIPLFSGRFTRGGNVTHMIDLWDAGTEVNQIPGMGADQAPRQAGPDTGADEDGIVDLVNDGFSYPSVRSSIRVTIKAE